MYIAFVQFINLKQIYELNNSKTTKLMKFRLHSGYGFAKARLPF